MPLLQADVLLTRARLFLSGDLVDAWDYLNEAKRLVNKHDYHRRDAELQEATSVLEHLNARDSSNGKA
jgi:hypothetical protein